MDAGKLRKALRQQRENTLTLARTAYEMQGMKGTPAEQATLGVIQAVYDDVLALVEEDDG